MKAKGKPGAFGGRPALSQPEPLKITEGELEALQATGFRLTKEHF